MRRFVIKLAVTALPVALILLGVNYLVDPAKRFDNEYEMEMARIVADGKYVTAVSNYDERLFRKNLVRLMTWAPDVAVIGSSRTLLIGSDHFKGLRVFNSSVSGASIEDLVALYQLMKGSGKLPRKILLGVDPWMFNDSYQDVRWKSLEGYYYEYIMGRNSQQVEVGKLTDVSNLLSLSYFQAAIKYLVKHGKGTAPIRTGSKYNDGNTVLSDGSLVYGREFREVDTNELDRRANEYIRGDIYGLHDYHAVSNRKWDLFSTLVGNILRSGPTLELVMVPYHPRIYGRIVNSYPVVAEVEARLRCIATSHSLVIRGSYDPSEAGASATCFYDGMHCNEQGVARLLEGDIQR